jgi:hypothetical protein
MFIETHKNDSIILTFLKSLNVQAFPCGRRRSKLVDVDNDGDRTPDTSYYIPFDPEAKLNTEANNRKHSGLNGYTQTYVKGLNSDVFSIVLAGYLFDIKAGNTYSDIGNLIATALRNFYVAENLDTSYDSEEAKETDRARFEDDFDKNTKLYANIRLEDIQLLTGFQEYTTSVLRDQTVDGIPSVYLDICNAADDSDYNNYYFSGLSFSTAPLTSIAAGHTGAKTREQLPHAVTRGNTTINQQLVSLCILEKVDKKDASGNIIYKTDEEGNATTEPEKEWKLYQPALLPFIEHDIDEDSVKMGETHVRKNLTVDENATVTNTFIVTDRVEVATDTTVKNKLVVENDVEVLDNKITTKDLESTNVITAKVINADEEITSADGALVDNITANKATIKNLNSDDIQQKVSGLADISEGYYDAPVIFLKKVDNDYQLQITRINKLN